MTHQAAVIRHYGTNDLKERVQEALRGAGLGDGVIQWDALAPLDQFHVGGAAATRALASLLEIAPGQHVLDVGCGLGGPARALAALRGAVVTGIDLNASFIGLAEMLTLRAGLAEQVSFQVGDATELPFAPASFDHAWTQHVAMNIADRGKLYSEVYRVLRPGGRFAIYDVVAGEEALHFPVPWARDASTSFVISAEATRAALEACGFLIMTWNDATAAGVQWAGAQASAQQERPEPLRLMALPLVMGPEFPGMAANLGRNLREGRARLLQAVVQRPA